QTHARFEKTLQSLSKVLEAHRAAIPSALGRCDDNVLAELGLPQRYRLSYVEFEYLQALTARTPRRSVASDAGADDWLTDATMTLTAPYTEYLPGQLDRIESQELLAVFRVDPMKVSSGRPARVDGWFSIHSRRDGRLLCGSKVTASLPTGAGTNREMALREAFTNAAEASVKRLSTRVELFLF
ncbi:MAG: hypothetical protein K0S65_6304, partial [Labilithrix sp.]|nr:hypothetical protein [Labilithrix sp.]